MTKKSSILFLKKEGKGVWGWGWVFLRVIRHKMESTINYGPSVRLHASMGKGVGGRYRTKCALSGHFASFLKSIRWLKQLEKSNYNKQSLGSNSNTH